MTKDDLKTLLAGRGTGAPLFLAWAIGVVATFPLTSFLTSLGDSDGMWPGFIASLFPLSIWQMHLILAPLRKRMLWIAISAVTALLMALFDQSGASTDFWLLLSMGMMLQAPLLIGIRKRFWLWWAVAVFGNPIAFPFGEGAYGLHNDLLATIGRIVPGIPKVLIPNFDAAYAMALMVVLGGVTAFLMPPVDSKETPDLIKV